MFPTASSSICRNLRLDHPTVYYFAWRPAQLLALAVPILTAASLKVSRGLIVRNLNCTQQLDLVLIEGICRIILGLIDGVVVAWRWAGGEDEWA